MMLNVLVLFLGLSSFSVIPAHDHGPAEIVYQWNTIEFEWPNDTMKAAEISNGNYIPENSAVNGIKIYKGKVYVTVPRLKAGVPSTLNVVVLNPSATSPNVSENYMLRAYPSWEMQRVGDCMMLQGVQSMEIDPYTGNMWIIDTGTRPGPTPNVNVSVQPIDKCPPKIIIYDINNEKIVHKYTFPASVVETSGQFYLNDLVLGFHEGKARYAFISDTLAYKLVVYDMVEDTSFSYQHTNMQAQTEYMNITIGDITLPGVPTGINGIAMSPDYKYLYYSSVAGVSLHQIETSVVTSAKGDGAKFAASVRDIGEKVSQGDGMVCSENHNVYYSALGPNAVYKWEAGKDLGSDGDFGKIQLATHNELVSDVKMEWVDTLAIDEDMNLWFTTSRLHNFFRQGGVPGGEPNFFIWRMNINEKNYMATTGPVQGVAGMTCSIFSIILCVLAALFSI